MQIKKLSSEHVSIAKGYTRRRASKFFRLRRVLHNGQIAAFYRPFTSVVQKIALTAIVDQADNGS
jgi:hypothetical protein